jgi:hypothetical protein
LQAPLLFSIHHGIFGFLAVNTNIQTVFIFTAEAAFILCYFHGEQSFVLGALAFSAGCRAIASFPRAAVFASGVFLVTAYDVFLIGHIEISEWLRDFAVRAFVNTLCPRSEL